MSDFPQKIALVYDHVNKWGGAEEVLLALHQLFPAAPLYTSVYSAKNASWAKVFPQIVPSFLNKIKYLQNHHELIPWLTPLAFESFIFNEFDAVISITSADAKGIITSPRTFHFNYSLTPTRYLWSHHKEYSAKLPALFLPVFNYLKHWDLIASKRPDFTVSISKTVKQRNQNYYNLDTQVVYPLVNTKIFEKLLSPPAEKDYFIYLGRLVPYKNPELIIKAFNKLDKKLVVIGTGSEESKIRHIANQNIIFKGFVSQEEKVSYLQHCQALIFFHEEDFGIVPVEAQAAGRPVIALNKGGASETIINRKTGILIDELSESNLIEAVKNFSPADYSSDFIQKSVLRFSNERFASEFAKIFLTAWTNYKNTSMSRF